jgi:hypothetical protein
VFTVFGSSNTGTAGSNPIWGAAGFIMRLHVSWAVKRPYDKLIVRERVLGHFEKDLEHSITY